MAKLNKKLEKFAHIYDDRKKVYGNSIDAHKNRDKWFEERIEAELGGPTVFYSDFNELIKEYEALTNRNRIKALEYLTVKDKASLTEIAKHLGTSIPTARKHLEILQSAGMVSSKSITTDTGKTRIFIAERKLVKKGKEEELLRERILKLKDKNSLVFNVVKNAVLEIVRSKEFHEYIKKARIEVDWEITDSIHEIVKDSLNEVIFEPYPSIQPIDDDNFYEYESNFEILILCGRFDLIDRDVEEKIRLYTDLAVFRDLSRDEVLANIKKHLEYIERIKEELRKKHGIEDG